MWWFPHTTLWLLENRFESYNPNLKFKVMKYNWNKENLEKAVKESDSYSEVLRKLEIPLQGNNTSTLKRKIEEYNIDISHFTFGK